LWVFLVQLPVVPKLQNPKTPKPQNPKTPFFDLRNIS